MNIYKQLRKSFGYTQSELANKLNLNQTTVGKWENGKAVPDYPTLINLAKLYGVSTDYLLGNGQNNVEELLPKENTITVFGYGGKRRDYHLSEENAKLLEQLAEKMSKEKIDEDF